MRRYAGLLIGIAAALLFARLGVWQLSRRAERRALNAVVAARMALPPLILPAAAALLREHPDSLRFRRAWAAGRFDFANQVVEIGRSFQGAPGVYVMTPLRLDDGTIVLVNRGWAYSPDGVTVDADSLREPDSTVVDGVLRESVGRFAVRPDTLRLGGPVLPLVLHRLAPAPGMPPALRVVPLPPPADGPHLSYAIQWFSFAVIALVGGALLARRDARGRATPEAQAGTHEPPAAGR